METAFPDAIGDDGKIKNEDLYEYILISIKLSLRHNYDDYTFNIFNRDIIFMNPLKYLKIKKAISVKTLNKLTILELTKLFYDLRMLENVNDELDSDKKKVVTK
jgi:hypothetical protein